MSTRDLLFWAGIAGSAIGPTLTQIERILALGVKIMSLVPPKPSPCKACDGTGKAGKLAGWCQSCNGAGFVKTADPKPVNPIAHDKPAAVPDAGDAEAPMTDEVEAHPSVIARFDAMLEFFQQHGAQLSMIAKQGEAIVAELVKLNEKVK